VEGNLEQSKRFEELQKEILDTYQQHLQEEVSKIQGVEVQFNEPFIGLWDGSYEPSLNMTLTIQSLADTESLSNLLFDMAENTSQDAFIIEQDSKLPEGEMLLTVEDSEGYTHYPQVVVEFEANMTVEGKSSLAKALVDEGITE